MLKKSRIYAVIGIFILSFLCHFIFEWFPNVLFSVFFPVNESIWEHMKILTTATLLYSFIDKIVLKKLNVKYNNYNLQLFISSVLSIPLYLIIYLPIYSLIKENIFVSISLLLIIYIIMQYISYIIMQKKQIKFPNYIFNIIIIIVYIFFAYLTYNPPQNYIFYDTEKEIYGIER